MSARALAAGSRVLIAMRKTPSDRSIERKVVPLVRPKSNALSFQAMSPSAPTPVATFSDADWFLPAGAEELALFCKTLFGEMLFGKKQGEVADGLQRDRPQEEARAGMHNLFRGALNGVGANVVEIRGPWNEREAQAASAVAAALEED